MKKQELRDITYCDNCGSSDHVYDRYRCLGCGKDHCYDCHKSLGTDYPAGVGFTGSGDGYFCSACLTNPPNEQTGQLILAYRVLLALREEREIYYRAFEVRTKLAEEEVTLRRSLMSSEDK